MTVETGLSSRRWKVKIAGDDWTWTGKYSRRWRLQQEMKANGCQMAQRSKQLKCRWRLQAVMTWQVWYWNELIQVHRGHAILCISTIIFSLRSLFLIWYTLRFVQLLTQTKADTIISYVLWNMKRLCERPPQSPCQSCDRLHRGRDTDKPQGSTSSYQACPSSDLVLPLLCAHLYKYTGTFIHTMTCQ